MPTPNTNDGVTADFAYASPHSKLNLRWSGDGAEINTGAFEPHPVFVRNARRHPDSLTMEANGFQLVTHKTSVDFFDDDNVGAAYFPQMEKLLRDVTGADKAVILHGLRRDLARPRGRVFGAGTDVHVDYCEAEAKRLSRSLLGVDLGAPIPYRRYQAINLWRALSPPPQDVPLAVCDARSVVTQKGSFNTLIQIEKQPSPEERMVPPPDVEDLPKGWIFHYDPAHRWYYYPDMTKDELLLFKLYDSTEEGAWRSPHAAFTDPSVPAGTPARESYEVRSFVYFK